MDDAKQLGSWWQSLLAAIGPVLIQAERPPGTQNTTIRHVARIFTHVSPCTVVCWLRSPCRREHVTHRGGGVAGGGDPLDEFPTPVGGVGQ